MKKIILLTLVSLFLKFAHANDSLFVKLNKKEFNKGDTINVDCYLKYSTKEMAAVTLNVWIEDIQKTRIWKYRFPLLNGIASFDMRISDSLHDGKYAMNFLIQQQFFNLSGKVRDYYSKMKGLTMMMLSKNKDNYLTTIIPDNKGYFSVGKIAFPDTARFIFSPLGKHRGDLYVDIRTPLDSSFTPYLTQTEMVTVGNPKLLPADTIKPYTLNEKRFSGVFTLEEVVVTSTRKKLVEKFDEEVTSGLFKGDAKVFDGLENTELASSTDIFMFLSGRVPGLQIMPDNEGGYNITRRGAKVNVYLDEFKLDPDNMGFINPADVAMIKVFAPLEGPGTSGGGSIAVYTKRGTYIQNSNRKNNFPVLGYSPEVIVWK